jgi:hypothetical protein
LQNAQQFLIVVSKKASSQSSSSNTKIAKQKKRSKQKNRRYHTANHHTATTPLVSRLFIERAQLAQTKIISGYLCPKYMFQPDDLRERESVCGGDLTSKKWICKYIHRCVLTRKKVLSSMSTLKAKRCTRGKRKKKKMESINP